VRARQGYSAAAAGLVGLATFCGTART
jgi:hypothetical protein